MLTSMLRDLRSHPGRLMMTLAAIVLSVAFTAASWIFVDSVNQSLTEQFTRTDFAVLVDGAERPMTPADRGRLASQPGVRGVNGVLSGRASFIQNDGKIGDHYQPSAGGTNWAATQRFHLIAGHAPTGVGEVALGEAPATDGGKHVGDTVVVRIGQGRSVTRTVAGIFTYRGVGHEYDPAVAFPAATAVDYLGEHYQRFELLGDDPAAIATAVHAAEPSLPRDAVLTLQDVNHKMRDQLVKDSEETRRLLLSFAGLALLVGVMVIVNTFTILVAQRTRQFALFRAIGASRRQVRRSIVTEAAVIGFCGATLGAGAGIGVAKAGLVLVRTVGAPVLHLSITPTALVLAYLVGVGTTVLAAYGSARRAATVAPIAALRTDAAVTRGSTVVRTVVGAVALVGGAGTGSVVLQHQHLTTGQRAVAGIAVLVAWIGTMLLAPLLATAVLRPLAAIGRRGGASLRMATGNVCRDPRRTAATASAVMLGTALICAFATLMASAQSQATGHLTATLPASTSIVRSAGSESTLDLAVWRTVRHTAGVTTAAALRPIPSLDRADGAAYLAVDAGPLPRLVHLQSREGSMDVAGGAVVPMSAKRHPGQTLRVPTADGRTLSVPIRGVYQANSIVDGTLIDVALVPGAAHLPAARILAAGPGAAGALRSAFGSQPEVVVADRAAEIDDVVGQYRLVLRILLVLLAIGVVIALFGVVNTLALSVAERTREIGVARAIGASRRLIRRIVRLESITIAAYGAVIGTGTGLLMGAVLQRLVLDTGFADTTVPVGTVAGAFAGLVFAGMLAGWWPARRAASTPVLTAIATH